MEQQTENPAVKKIYCNKCKSDTNHKFMCKHEVIKDWGVDANTGEGYWVEIHFRFWICAGCETGVLEEYYTMEGNYDENGDQIWDSIYYPKRTEKNIIIKQFQKLPPTLIKIYN